MKAVVGLGNPGCGYATTRHNVGFMCVERLSQRVRLRFSRREARSAMAYGTWDGTEIGLFKPQTFMNLSGEAVGPIRRRHRLALPDLLVVHDDIDLPLGTLRLRPTGGAGGHRGIESIIRALGTQEFPRMRIGVGRPPEGLDPIDYVLSDFAPAERALLESALERATEAAILFLREGIQAAMNQYNSRGTEVSG